MSNHSHEMHQHIDPNGIIGTICTFLIYIIGFITINEYAVIIGIGVGITTIGLNIMKWINEYKRGRLIEHPDEEEDDDDQE
jgi:hypothetical protein